MDDFVDVYAVATGRKQRVPRHFLADPVLGRGIRLTPSQRELDGDLGPRPTQDSKVPEIDKYADKAGIDLTGLSTKDEKLSAVEAVFAFSGEQTGLVEVEVADAPADPLAPALVAQGDPSDMPGVNVGDPVADSTTTSTAGTEPTDETPAAGDEEN
jgi:hypothetical protein